MPISCRYKPGFLSFFLESIRTRIFSRQLSPKTSPRLIKLQMGAGDFLSWAEKWLKKIFGDTRTFWTLYELLPVFIRTFHDSSSYLDPAKWREFASEASTTLMGSLAWFRGFHHLPGLPHLFTIFSILAIGSAWCTSASPTSLNLVLM